MGLKRKDGYEHRVYLKNLSAPFGKEAFCVGGGREGISCKKTGREATLFHWKIEGAFHLECPT